METDDGYIFITQLPLYSNYYVIGYSIQDYFIERAEILNSFTLLYVKRIHNVETVYNQLLNSHYIQYKMTVNINGNRFNLLKCSFTIDEFDDMLYKGGCVDVSWNNRKYITYKSDLLNYVVDDYDDLNKYNASRLYELEKHFENVNFD